MHKGYYIVTNKGNITVRIKVGNKKADHVLSDILIEVGDECHPPDNKDCSVFRYNRNGFISKLGSMLECEKMDDINEYVFGYSGIFYC